MGATAHGQVTIHSNGSFEYVPNTDYAGGDSFRWRRRILGNPGVVLTQQINVRPVVVAHEYEMMIDGALVVSDADGLLKDSIGNFIRAYLVTNPTYGEIALNIPNISTPGGGFTYTPPATTCGTDTFTYNAFPQNDYSGDATHASNIEQVTIVVLPPLAVDDWFDMADYAAYGEPAIIPAPGVLENDRIPAGMGAYLLLGEGNEPTKGTVVVRTDGSFTYTKTPGQVGLDSFRYRLGYTSDPDGAHWGDFEGHVLTSTATVEILL